MDGAERFEQWMKEEEERMKSGFYDDNVEIVQDKRRLPMFRETEPKVKQDSQLSLF